MMEIQTEGEILDYEGQPIPTATGAKLTFREAAFTALNSVAAEEVPTAEVKERMFAITSKLYRGAVVVLSIEEAAFLKERSGLIMSPLVHGRLCQILETGGQE